MGSSILFEYAFYIKNTYHAGQRTVAEAGEPAALYAPQFWERDYGERKPGRRDHGQDAQAFRVEVVRGSSKRKGHGALIGLINSIRQGKSDATAVDGPRGPLHKVKKGVVFLAGRLQVPIIPVATGVKRYWVMEKTWDKLIVPAPFTEGLVLYGEPIKVNGTSKEEIESKRKDLEIVLCRLTREAAEDAAAPREEIPVIRNRPWSSQ